MNKDIPLDQIQDSDVSTSELEALIDTNKELFDQLNAIPEIEALDAISIEEEKQYQLSDYEYEKEEPTWKYGRDYVTTGRWKMEVVSDQDYVNFQKSEEL